MRRTGMLHELRRMRFAEVYSKWSESRLSQGEAVLIVAHLGEGCPDGVPRRVSIAFIYFG